MQTITYLTTLLLTMAAITVQTEDIVLIGRLTRLAADVPECGVYITASMSEYEVVKILRGTYPDAQVYVVHPCGEMPRQKFSKKADTLNEFNVGDLHKLVLTPKDIYNVGRGLDSTHILPNGQRFFYGKQVDLYKKGKKHWSAYSLPHWR